jgi:hypothetical protein
MSGRQGDVEITEGKVKGDEVSFDVTMTMQGNAMKMTYKGKVAGDEIKFSRHRDGSDRTSEFTAHRGEVAARRPRPRSVEPSRPFSSRWLTSARRMGASRSHGPA